MAKLEQASTEVTEGGEEQNPLLKAKPQPQSQPEMDESLERLTKQVAKGGGIAFDGSVIGKVATFGLHILLGRGLWALRTIQDLTAAMLGGSRGRRVLDWHGR